MIATVPFRAPADRTCDHLAAPRGHREGKHFRTLVHVRFRAPVAVIVASLTVLTMTSSSHGGEIVYQPINPGFGGSPLNEDYLVGTAQIQNPFQAPSGGGSNAPDINFPPIDIDLGGVGGTPTIIIPLPTNPTAPPDPGSATAPVAN